MENSDFDYYLPFTWFCNTSVKDIFAQKMIKQTKRRQRKLRRKYQH